MSEDPFAQPASKLGASGIGVAAAPTGGMGLALGANGKLDGSLLASASVALAALAAPAFTAYTPAWTATGTAPALGNGTLSGSYYQIGKLVVCRIALTMGSTTTFGTGTYLFSLPVNQVASIHTGTVYANDLSAVAVYFGFALYNAASTILCGTPAQPSPAYTPTVPFTWASGDDLRIDYIYEAA